ncbi:MAG: adenylate/guanylate cyclase domain-containing protein [Chloroflexi bacterium]|nr:adenylate/guanylate cyclase domain-containing protein [Chloroflexota bacterium]
MVLRRSESRGRVRASPEALWPFVSDTPRINRAVGAPPIDYTIVPADTGGSKITATARIGPFTLARWTEYPFLWREPYGYSVVREFLSGPLARMTLGVDLRREGGETAVRIFAELEPRNLVGVFLIRCGLGQRMTDTLLAQCTSFDRYLSGQAAMPFPKLAPRRPPPDRSRSLIERLCRRGCDTAIVERLVEHLATASDEDVVLMRPFELADRWNLEKRPVLATFLHATIAGLVTLRWDVLCPNCRVGKRSVGTLRELRKEAHCDVCNIVFDASFDRLVEVRFTVAPSIRVAQAREYCIGGPRNTPHVVVQIPVPAGAVERVACRLRAGLYRARSAQATQPAGVDVVDGGPSVPLALTLTPDGLTSEHAVIGAGDTELVVENRLAAPAVLALEELRWSDSIATAAVVSTMAEFRDLFSSEVLAPGLQLGVSRLAFLFTDLTGSTALYQRVGQARAFRIVQDQFAILGEVVAGHRGAIVKTIGDAIMATFESGADALAAAVMMQRRIRELDLRDDADPARLLKIGVHQGPCVAVTLNDRLDYFGTTVNIAARTEHEARGGQIVATADVCDSAEAQAVLSDGSISTEATFVALRGISEPVGIVRLTLTDAATPSAATPPVVR